LVKLVKITSITWLVCQNLKAHVNRHEFTYKTEAQLNCWAIVFHNILRLFPSVLRHCWKGIRPVKSWVLVCWWWWFDWSFARLRAPVVTTTVPLSLAPRKPANPGSPGKMAVKTDRQRENLLWLPVSTVL